MSVARSSFTKRSWCVDKKDLLRRCQHGLLRAICYLVENQTDREGGWSDFATNRSGESTSWVTAYVLWQSWSLLPPKVVRNSLRTLLLQRQNGGGWGFSEFVPPDCDSTLHVLQAILESGIRQVDVLEPIRFVLAHQSKDGGFSTYRDSLTLIRYRGIGNDIDYYGWLKSHVCVTALALETLKHFPEFIPFSILDKTTDFLLANQASDGYWESYWWRSKYFATTRIIEQFSSSMNNTKVKEAANKALSWVTGSVKVEGYWDNGYDPGIPCLLSTANSVRALLAISAESELIFRVVTWLLDQQHGDGSWRSMPVLQIPPPHVKDPKELRAWRIGERGVGSRCLDEKHIYSTSTILDVIYHFVLRFGDGIKHS